MTGPTLTATERAAVEEWLRSEEALERMAEAYHEGRRAEYPGARGPIAVEWRVLTEQEREMERAVARRILAALRDER